MNMIEETLKVLLKLRSYFQPSTNLPGVRISSPSIRQHGQGKACPVPIPVSRCDGSRSRCKTVAENNSFIRGKTRLFNYTSYHQLY